ncbi:MULTISPECIES: ribonuclease HII [Eubacteriales]|uniref:Ribonuclease HII n=1 Tax=Bittarella massiliensis (ex Durand et al. 2017) TaxID=1720313 RepID=A0AAQ1MBP8_9FIRM|nr:MULTISPECIES: ribonuclease HII [Eubacteriales]ERJ00392.1 ribonuclease HII [Clostridium sp. ATCC 29733]SHF74735.1 RNase HII [Bittarella massiliensis (ex Durand et al. 2017)]
MSAPALHPELLAFDRDLRQRFGTLCGVDEAGRGPLAGPVCAAAVVLPEGYLPEGLNDSKKLTEKRRELLFDEIRENAVAYSVQLVDNEIIDDINILNATMQAMAQAIAGLGVPVELALIDGNRCPPANLPCQAVVQGDARSASIAAASILAKVTRDRLMLEYDQLFPGYGFARHKGYPTKAHYQALTELGVTPIHRLTFLKKWKGRSQ